MIRRVALAAVAALVGAALAEQCVRVLFFGAGAFSYAAMRSEFGARIFRMPDDPELVYELKPGVDALFKLERLTTNSFGMADVERSLRKPPGEFRIVALGDSFTMPWGFPRETTYPAVIERDLLAERRPVEVLNFGVGGYDLRQYVAVLESKALAFDPDLVLIGWCGDNDHIPLPDEYYSHPHPIPFRSGFLHSYTWDLARLALGWDATDAAEHYTPEEARYIERMFGRMRAAAGRRPVVVAQLGMVERRGPELAALAGKFGFAFVDAAPAFRGRPLKPFVRSGLDRHPNPLAHRLYAGAILGFLRERRLLPPARTGGREPVSGSFGGGIGWRK